MQNWKGEEIPAIRSKGGTLAVCDPMDNLIKADAIPWPPPEIVQKLYQSRQINSFRESDHHDLIKSLGFYCDLQSLHSEDALTWSVFGPLIYADDSARRNFSTSLLDYIKVPITSIGKTTIWLWRRLAHPETLVPGGPEIDFGIQTGSIVVLGEAKWLSGIGEKQGMGKNKDQLTLRREFIETYGPAVFREASDFVLLMVAPIMGMIDRREVRPKGRTIYFREIPWDWLCSLEGHPCGEELIQYLKWKKINSKNFEKRVWRWTEGSVDTNEEHIKITFEERPEHVALVGNYGGQITVQFLDSCDRDVKAAVRDELNFYFEELREPNPWGYAIYHCSTMANVYSKVHWGYYPGES